MTIVGGEHARARRRHDVRPPQPPAPAGGVGPALRPAARGATSRCSATRDVPGMIGRVGTAFGEHGRQHRLGRRRPQPDDEDGGGATRNAVMAITTRRAGPAGGHRRDRRGRRLRRRSRRHALTRRQTRLPFRTTARRRSCRTGCHDGVCDVASSVTMPGAERPDEEASRGERRGAPAGVGRRAAKLKEGALGYVSNLVIGVASTAPATRSRRRSASSSPSPASACTRRPCCSSRSSRCCSSRPPTAT